MELFADLCSGFQILLNEFISTTDRLFSAMDHIHMVAVLLLLYISLIDASSYNGAMQCELVDLLCLVRMGNKYTAQPLLLLFQYIRH